ncbi:MAG: hypothetical protein L0Z62_13665 [Gemmataceae bacterium]|nr:hypothetical protein [Gemmataceae bacterium]
MAPSRLGQRTLLRSVCALLFLLLGAALVGCGGGSKASVKGKVAYGGKTVKFGEVVIYGGDGVPRTAKIDREGNYSIPEIISGNGKIAVHSLHPKEVLPPGRDSKAEPDPEDVKNWFPLPESYRDPNTSGQTITINPGSNTHDINLPEK